MKEFIRAIQTCCDDPLEVLGAIATTAGIAGAWVGFYLLGF